jgi:hypothetical protein
MKYEVQLYQGGKVFIEEVYANDVKSAKETAQSAKSIMQSYWSKCFVSLIKNRTSFLVFIISRPIF